VIDADSPGADAVVEAESAAGPTVVTVGQGAEGIVLEGTEQDGFRQHLFLTYEGQTYSVGLPLAGGFLCFERAGGGGARARAWRGRG